MVPMLLCSACGHQIALPFRRFTGTSVVEPYWPSPEGGLEWVCDRCNRHQTCSERGIEWIADDLIAVPPASRGFWRVEIACWFPGCVSTVVVHVQTFGQTSRRDLGLTVASSALTPVCGLAHAVQMERSYPERVDFIEWDGSESYLT